MAWSDPDNRAHFLKQLEDYGYDEDRLQDLRQLVDASQSDLYDVLAYVLFTNPPKTRHDRAQAVRDSRMSSFKDEMAELLLTILNAYEATGESELATRKLGQFLTARYGSVGESKGKLGELATVRDAFRRMQLSLYDDR
jgi:type I restriction enzyme, R subunit